MLDREGELNIDYGLPVIFDGKSYVVLVNTDQNKSGITYPIGGLLCEYMRLRLPDLKNIILSCDGLEKEGTEDGLKDAFLQFCIKLQDSYPPVTSRMLQMEFFNSVQDWFQAKRAQQTDEYLKEFSDSEQRIKKFIFNNTGFSDVGGSTVLQILLTSYLAVSEKFSLAKYMFINAVDDAADEESKKNVMDVFARFYTNNMDFQHIDYRIVMTEVGFESLYTMKSTFSLLAFDMANVMTKQANIVKCKNCGNFFVTEGRSDAVYCSYPLDDNKDKTCKDVGAQVARANKEKTDALTREYRKVYLRYKMAISRHPDNKEMAEKFKKLTEGFKTRKAELASGASKSEEILEWLKSEF